MSIKIASRKTGCYYEFLKGIEEEYLPIFTEQQINLLKYASSLLPLVRPCEYTIMRALISQPLRKEVLWTACRNSDNPFRREEFDHAIKYMEKKGQLEKHGEFYSLVPETDEQFREHFEDLLDYGLSRFQSEYNGETGFLLWHSYTMNSVQLKLLKDPDYNQKGTYIYGKEVVIFASLKKDASVEERLQYKDKFLTDSIFQWESENNINPKALKGLIESDFAYVFIRKVSEENGIVLPFTYNHIESIEERFIEKEMTLREGRCPRCGGVLKLRNGKYGPFYGCSNYPNCKFTHKAE